MEQLGQELVDLVLQYVSRNDLQALGLVSRAIHQLIHATPVWQSYFNPALVGAWAEHVNLLPVDIAWYQKIRSCRQRENWPTAFECPEDAAVLKKEREGEGEKDKADSKSVLSVFSRVFAGHKAPRDKYVVTLIGPGGTGVKTSLMERLARDNYTGEYKHTIEEQQDIDVKVQKNAYTLTLVATVGHLSNERNIEKWTSKSDCLIIGYSITDRSSFSELESFRTRILQARARRSDKNWDLIPTVLVANKTDLDEYRRIPTAEGEDLALRWNVPFFETSVKNNKNLDALLETVVHTAEDIRQNRHITRGTLKTRKGSTYTGEMINMLVRTGINKGQVGDVPTGNGKIEYTLQDNAILEEYNGEWSTGQKHGKGTLVLRCVDSSHDERLARTFNCQWAYDKLVSLTDANF